MKTLAIDTSLAIGSVAAADATRTLQIALPAAGEHARRIGSALVEVLERGEDPTAWLRTLRGH